MRDRDYLEMAISQAHIAESLGEVPVGAVLVGFSGDILASGYNKPIAQNDPTAHAEIVTLRLAGLKKQNYRLIDTTMYVTLEPCPMCIAAMVHARVSRVVYACRDLRTGACGTALNLAQHEKLNHKVSTEFIEIAYARQLLQAFFKRRR